MLPKKGNKVAINFPSICDWGDYHLHGTDDLINAKSLILESLRENSQMNGKKRDKDRNFTALQMP